MITDNLTGGDLSMKNFQQLSGPMGSNLFFKDDPISPLKKIVVSEDDSALWQASHFGVTVDNFP